jgi:hypothetical protein
MTIVKAAILAIAVSGAPQANVTLSEPGQAEITYELHVPAKAADAYAAVIQPGRWWDSGHTWSGDAKNFTLEARAGGCWCEPLPDGGSVEHMHVVFVQPGKVLRLTGALGPLQSQPLAGVMTWAFKDDAGGSVISFRYRYAGPIDAKENGPAIVDAVLGQQMQRLQHLLETP